MVNLQMMSSEVKSIIGYPVTDDNDKFVLELSNPELRYRLFSQCKTLKPNGLFLSEFLTKKRDELMYKLRCLKKTNKKMKRVYSDHGRVFCLIEGHAGLKRVFQIEDVQDLI